MAGVRNQRGNFSVTAIIAIISCVLFFYLVNAITPLLNYKRQIVASNIKTTLNNSEALKTIVNLPENSAMACLKAGTCTYTTTLQPLKVVGLDGTPLSDGSNVGIDNAGQPCSTTSGQSNCLFTILVKWRPLCPADGSACINPPVEITSETTFTGGLMKFVLNFKNLDFKIRVANVATMLN